MVPRARALATSNTENNDLRSQATCDHKLICDHRILSFVYHPHVILSIGRVLQIELALADLRPDHWDRKSDSMILARIDDGCDRNADLRRET
jgi:hypothetical protein